MKRKEPTITESELFAAMDQARAFVGEFLNKPPAGYFSVNQYAERHGLGRNAARTQLTRLFDTGYLDKVKAYEMTSGGRCQVMVFYGLKRRKAK